MEKNFKGSNNGSAKRQPLTLKQKAFIARDRMRAAVSEIAGKEETAINFRIQMMRRVEDFFKLYENAGVLSISKMLEQLDFNATGNLDHKPDVKADVVEFGGFLIEKLKLVIENKQAVNAARRKTYAFAEMVEACRGMLVVCSMFSRKYINDSDYRLPFNVASVIVAMDERTNFGDVFENFINVEVKPPATEDLPVDDVSEVEKKEDEVFSKSLALIGEAED